MGPQEGCAGTKQLTAACRRAILRVGESGDAGKGRAVLVLTAARTGMGLQFQSIAAQAAPLQADLALSYADLGTLA